MTLIGLDSRSSLGTDIDCSRYPGEPNSGCILYPERHTVRVILGHFGRILRMSAPEIDLVVEANTRDEAWAKFLAEARSRQDAAWLTFDVGPTRREEIAEGLNAPEDEDWVQVICDPEE